MYVGQVGTRWQWHAFYSTLFTNLADRETLLELLFN